jgi:predicted nucleotidyltransferase
MVSDAEREIIIRCAQKYGASRVYLFGSCAQSEGGYHDIDVAVDGIPPQQFFRFYAELMRNLHKPVDLLDLSERNPLVRVVLEEGIIIYG